MPTMIRGGARALRQSPMVALLVWFVCAAGPVAAEELDFEVAPGALGIPAGPGSTEGASGADRIDPGTGALTWSLPLDVPPGPGRFEPALQLVWSSSSPDGELGPGWTMGLGRICRGTEAGARALPWPAVSADPLPVLVSGMGGADGRWWPVADAPGTWAQESDGSNRLRPGDGDTGWVLETPDGVVHHFGATSESREGPDTSGASGTACWRIDGSEDRWGNRITYVWEQDGGVAWPKEIRWAEATSSPRAVRVLYEARTIERTSWRNGFRQTWRRRASRVEAVVERSAAGGGARTLHSWELSWSGEGGADRLVALAKVGADGARLPATTFVWGSMDTYKARRGVLAEAPSAVDGASHRLVDLDADGYPDVVRMDGDGWTVVPGTPGGPRGAARAVAGAPAVSGPSREGLLVDVDGDGLPDWIRRGVEGPDRVSVWRNVSERGAYRFDAGVALSLEVPLPLGDPRVRVADLNLDRRPDFLFSVDGRLHVVVSRVLSAPGERTDSRSEVSWSAAAPLVAESSGVSGVSRVELSDPGIALVDADADGVPDIVRFRGGAGGVDTVVVHAGVPGGGYGEGVEHALPSPVTDASRLLLVDVDRDGLVDLVQRSESEALLHPAWFSGAGAAPIRLALPEPGPDARLLVADLHGDRGVDFLVVTPGRAGWEVVEPSGSHAVGLLQRVENGLGGSIRYTWGPVASSDDAEAAIPGGMVVVVGREMRGRLGDAPQGVRWSWRGAVWDRRRGEFGGFASSTEVREGDAAQPSVAIDRVFHRGIAGEAIGFGGWLPGAEAGTLDSDVPALRGRLRSEVWREPGGRMLHQTVTSWQVEETAGGGHRIRPVDRMVVRTDGARMAPRPGTLSSDGGWTDRPRASSPEEQARWYVRTRWTWDERGELVAHDALGHVDGRGVDLPGDEVRTRTTWARSSTRHLLGLEARTTVVDGSGQVLTDRRVHYDGPSMEGLPEGQATRGAVTRESAWLDTEQRWVDRRRVERDAWGNIVRSVDALGHVVHTAWDDVLHAFPVSESRELTQGSRAGNTRSLVSALATEATWDLDRGVPTGARDVTGGWTRFAYDGLGRRTSATRPGEAEGRASSTWRRDEGVDGSIVVQTDRTGVGDEAVVTWSWRDGLGRELGIARGQPGRWLVEGLRTYGARGAVGRTCEPFEVRVEEPGRDPASLAPAGLGCRRVETDAEGRTVREIAPDGSTVVLVHLPGRVEVHDAEDLRPGGPHEGTPEIHGFDGQGRLVSVTTLVRGTDGRMDAPTWSFGHDAVGRSREVTLPDGTKRRWRHDSLGRMVEVDDPDAGVRTRHWDDTDALIAAEDADGHLVEWFRDPLGRVTSVQVRHRDAETSTELGRLSWDGAGLPAGSQAWARGRLSLAEETGWTVRLEYDALGQRVRERRSWRERSWETGRVMDRLGRVRWEVYADGSRVRVDRDALGRVTGVGEFLTDVSWDTRGLVESSRLGNGLVERTSWDAQRRLVSMDVGEGADAAVGLDWVWQGAGAITEVIDRVSPREVSGSAVIALDDLYRPVEAQYASFGTVRMTYDGTNQLVERTVSPHEGASASAARRLALGRVESGAPGGPEDRVRPHLAARDATGRTWRYDASGRRIEEVQADGRTYSTAWDELGRRWREVTADGVVREFVHSLVDGRVMSRELAADGRERLVRVRLGDREEIEWRDGGVRHRRYVHADARRVAELVRIEEPASAPAESVPLEAWLQRASSPVGSDEASPEEARGAVVPLVPGGRPGAGTGERGGEAPGDTTSPPAGAGSLGRSMAVAGVVLFVAGAAAVPRRRRGRAGSGARVFAGPRWRDGRALVVVVAVAWLGAVASCGEDGGRGGSGRPDRDPIERLRQWGEVFFWHVDPMGTLVAKTDVRGRVVLRRATDVSGVELARWSSGDVDTRIWFTGREANEDTGIVHFGARDLDPSTGRWLSPDEKALWGADSLAWFDLQVTVHVGNRWTLAVDLFGLDSFLIGVDGQVTAGPFVVSVSMFRASGDYGNDLTTVSVGLAFAPGFGVGVGGSLKVGETELEPEQLSESMRASVSGKYLSVDEIFHEGRPVGTLVGVGAGIGSSPVVSVDLASKELYADRGPSGAGSKVNAGIESSAWSTYTRGDAPRTDYERGRFAAWDADPEKSRVATTSEAADAWYEESADDTSSGGMCLDVCM